MSDDGENAFQKLKGWVAANNNGTAPPDAQTGSDAFAALAIVLNWCEERMSIEARRAMALEVDTRLLGG